MPKQQQDSNMLPYSGGLNTEANRFDYPPECTLDEQNFIITKDGKRERRLGIVLGDEDVNMVPDGLNFEDTVRITTRTATVEEDGELVETDVGLITDTYEATENVEEYLSTDTSRTYTGLTTFTLNQEGGSSYIFKVYSNGAYAELYRKTIYGSITLLNTYEAGDLVSLPFSIHTWETNPASAQVAPYFTLMNSESTIEDLRTRFESWIYSSNSKTQILYTGSKKISGGTDYRWHSGGRYSDGYSSGGPWINAGSVGNEFFEAAKTLDVINVYKVEIQTNTKTAGNYSGYGTVTTNAGASTWVTQDIIKITTDYETYAKWPKTREVTCSGYMRFKLTCSVIDQKRWVIFTTRSGEIIKFSSLDVSESESASVTVMLGSGSTSGIKKTSSMNTEPLYSAIVQAYTDPTKDVSVLRDNRKDYIQKTRIQLGKIASTGQINIPNYYIWRNAGGQQGLDFIVFYNNSRIVICDYAPPYFFNNVRWAVNTMGASDMAAVDGRLCFVNGYDSAVRCIEYDIDTQTFSDKSFKLKVRDQWGLSEKDAKNSKFTTVSKSYYQASAGNKTLDITHDKDSITREDYTVQHIGGAVKNNWTWTIKDSRTIRISYTQVGAGQTCIFSVTYSEEDGTYLNLDPDVRVQPNETRAYNLYNRGWGLPRKDDNGNQVSPLAFFYSKKNFYPAHDESVYTALQLNPGYYNSDSKSWTKAWERLYPDLWDDSRKSEETQIEAAPGNAIIELLDRGNTRWKWYQEQWMNGLNPTLSSIRADYTDGGPSCCCDYAGRMFFGGFSNINHYGDNCSPRLGSYLAFSRLVRSYEDMEKCYQEGDPTSRNGADIVDTDGGIVRISGAEGIVKLVACQKGLLIFAQNGVWMLMGGSDYGFTATNHKVQKLTSYGVIHKSSICGTGDQWMYFSDGGIMVLAPDQFGDIQCNNATYNTIHTLFKDYDYPLTGVKGTYDKVSGQYHWIVEVNSMYTTELIYIPARNCWTQNVFYNDQENGKFVCAPIALDEEFATNIGSSSQYRNYQSILYLCRTSTMDVDEDSETYTQPISKDYKIGYLGNKSYMDFGKNDAKAYLQSGPNNVGNAGVYKQVPWVNSYMVNTENVGTLDNPLNKSSCKLSASWDWATDSDTHRYTRWWVNGEELKSFELYRHRQPLLLSSDRPLPSYNSIIESRNKLRGRGKVFSVMLETEPARDCRIAGFNITINGNKIK